MGTIIEIYMQFKVLYKILKYNTWANYSVPHQNLVNDNNNTLFINKILLSTELSTVQPNFH